MKITIITATYNSGLTFRDTIESILAQTYDEIEYIVIDGGSSDNTLQILEQYKVEFRNSLRYICEKDHGIYDAMNKGIRMATGEIVGILNSDDFYMDEDIIAKVAEIFENTQCEAVCGNLYFVDAKNTDKVVRIWKGSPYIHGAFKKGWHPAHPTFFLKRECYEKYGVFDLDFSVSADFELMLRMIERFNIRVEYLDRFMVKMRIGGESTGSLKKIIQGNWNVMKAFRKNQIPVSYFYPVKRLVPKFIAMLKNIMRL